MISERRMVTPQHDHDKWAQNDDITLSWKHNDHVQWATEGSPQHDHDQWQDHPVLKTHNDHDQWARNGDITTRPWSMNTEWHYHSVLKTCNDHDQWAGNGDTTTWPCSMNTEWQYHLILKTHNGMISTQGIGNGGSISLSTSLNKHNNVQQKQSPKPSIIQWTLVSMNAQGTEKNGSYWLINKESDNRLVWSFQGLIRTKWHALPD